VRRTTAPDEKQHEWLFRYGHCLEQLGFLDDAMSVYRDFIHRWPGERKFMKYVQWRWQKNLQELAQQAWDGNRPAEALEHLDEALSTEWHKDLQQQGRYMAGQIQEELGSLEDALAWYEQILEDGDRFGGDVVAQAKDRIDAIHAQGVH
jgi:tetratricopeptide (TPR) repeat protein